MVAAASDGQRVHRTDALLDDRSAAVVLIIDPSLYIIVMQTVNRGVFLVSGFSQTDRRLAGCDPGVAARPLLAKVGSDMLAVSQHDLKPRFCSRLSAAPGMERLVSA
jgi:hypothetical protein